jgi:hypothetical protein
VLPGDAAAVRDTGFVLWAFGAWFAPAAWALTLR